MVTALPNLRSGGVNSWSSSYHFQKEGRKEARREGNGKCESRRRSVGKDNE